MAEIRSTLEMVMERAARMTDRSNTDSQKDEAVHAGMRTGAAFMRGNAVDLASVTAEVAESDQAAFRKGIIQTFLRNIMLPRGEDNVSEAAYTGLLELGKYLPDQGQQINTLIGEMRSILSRYTSHRAQMKEQLEENFSSQMAMLEQNLAQQTGVHTKLSPSQHPKFAEEWQKVLNSLNDQYESAISQYKSAITQQLTSG